MMRKKLPILILISIQLIFAVSLTAIKPVTEWLIANKGEEFIFEVEGVSAHYDEWADIAYIYAPIKGTTPPYREECKYGIIETKENGKSFISNVSENKPKDKPYLKSKYNFLSEKAEVFNGEISQDLYFEMFSYYGGEYVVTAEDLDFTIKATVYKGEIRTHGILINGIPIEEYIKLHEQKISPFG